MPNDIVIQNLLRAMAQQQEKSPYAAELREETHVLPAFCGLPRVIRAFPAQTH